MSDEKIAEAKAAPIYEHPVMCDDCGKVQLGTSDLPPDDQQGGVICDACAQGRRDSYQKQYAADFASVVGKKLTVDQARAVQGSSQWSTLSEGKRAAVQQVIDEAAPQL